MRLASGTRFGRYEIVAPLGAGGMGEVYRAHDSRLNRSVAIKILPVEVATDPEFRARFRREAEILAALKHPHICVLYDVADFDGVDCLVMELLEGETLADRLRHGPLPFGEALRWAIEIVSGLEAAHRQGINHRDLKPGNIMITPTGAKLLDFGLAKPRRVIGAGAQPDALTVEAALVTGRGAILGTLGYMAPEQLEGHEADARSDIFALGAILYEMTTGKRAFEGESQASLIAAILTGEPAVAALDERRAPPLFKKIVLKCLATDAEKRWQSAQDLGDALRWVDQETPHADRGAAPRHTRSRFLWIGATAAIAVSIAIAALTLRRPPADLTPLRLSVVAPPGTTFTARDITGHPQFALSPDGNRLAFVAVRRGERPQLWVRSLASGAAQPVPGTEDASGPFWAPDSQSLAFFARSKLKRVSLGGAPPLDLADVFVDVTSGTWNPDGVILFGGMGDGMFRVSAGGGPVTQATTLDPSRGETGSRWPQFLPDGRRFLFYLRSTTPQTSGVYVSAIDTDLKTQVLQSRASAVYAEPGHLLFEQSGSLTSQRFDARSGELSGRPIALGDQILGLFGPGYLPLSAARDGTLAYWNGRPPPTELQWVDRTGRLLGKIDTSVRSDSLALSPDATRLLVTLRPNPNQNEIWQIDLSSGVASLFTLVPAVGRFGIWSPDGQSVVFSGAGAPLYQKPASGAGYETLVPGPARHYAIFPEDWSRDGRWLIYSATAKTAWDVWVVDLTDDTARPILDTPSNEVQARLSPDGRWLAYTSDESGAWEVYVQPFPDGGGKWLVSTGGGSQPLWRGDGKELFYLAADGRLIAVSLGGGRTVEPKPIEPLFQTRVPPVLAPFRIGYAVSPDGQRFLLNNVVLDAEPSAITVVRHWRAGLEAQGPGRD